MKQDYFPIENSYEKLLGSTEPLSESADIIIIEPKILQNKEEAFDHLSKDILLSDGEVEKKEPEVFKAELYNEIMINEREVSFNLTEIKNEIIKKHPSAFEQDD